MTVTRRGTLLLVVVLCLPAAAADSNFRITPDIQSALDRISADSLCGHVSFLASDLLEGRDTPSPGLEIAAEYIAAQFRRAGLESPGEAAYAQTASFILVKPNFEGFEFVFERAGETVRIPKENVSVQASAALELSRAPVIKVNYQEADQLGQWTPEQMQGKVVVLTALPDFSSMTADQRRQTFETLSRVRRGLLRLKPALLVALRRGVPMGGDAPQRLRDPSDPSQAGPPSILVNDAEFSKAFDALPAGPAQATVSIRLARPSEQPVKLRNVVGVLRGSDPVLEDTCVLVTAHYDHTGARPVREGDGIFNGANDDASGVASVIELAAALAKLNRKPKRTIVFMTFFGEERGLLGSRYYARHPVVPIEKIVADINLEQLGRTDSLDGPEIARASLTGFDYSDVGETFRKAGELAGVTVFKDEKNSDAYFGRSDNQSFANLGIPAHTLSVTYFFPDYHRPGDEWEKLDYANMEKITRLTALGVLMIADNPDPPKWNEANPKAERYLKAWKQRMGR